MNDVISPGREFADGAEFKTRGTRSQIPDTDEGDTSQIPENLGSVPEFGAICKFTTGRDNVIHE